MSAPASRDRDFERELAAIAARRAALGGAAEAFADAVEHRLRKGQREYGAGTWATGGLQRLLAEMAEEGADGGGWGTLAAQLVQLSQLAGELDPARAELILTHLTDALAGAVVLWYHGTQALETLLAADGA